MTLPIVQFATDAFRCEKYACILTARSCFLRQKAKGVNWLGGKAVRTASPTTLFNGYCASGECLQGTAVQKALKGQKIEGPRPQDFLAQWHAKRRQDANPEPTRKGASHG